jgi:hypothetical protein
VIKSLDPTSSLDGPDPEVFGLQSVEESGWAVNFIRKLPRPILKTETVRQTESAYWVLSQLALCSPLAVVCYQSYLEFFSGRLFCVRSDLLLGKTKSPLCFFEAKNFVALMLAPDRLSRNTDESILGGLAPLATPLKLVAADH